MPEYPELVATDDKGIKSVVYANLAAALIEVVKELNAENEALKVGYKSVKAENEVIKADIAEIKRLWNSFKQ